jgi:class 3 adenylate cyclase/tetratricopeptide (TPR) repeat protein
MLGATAEFCALPTRAGIFPIAMKVGASRGAVLLGIVGNDAVGRDFYAAGPAMDDAAEAEHLAAPGTAVLHPSLVGGTTPGLEFEPRVDGFSLLRKPPALSGSPPGPATAPAQDLLFRLVPPYLHGFASGEAPGEHRGTAILFIAVSGLTVAPAGTEHLRLADAASHAHFHALYRLLSSTARRFGGVLNKLDMGDKGAKALVFFGSPTALEKREEMAIRCARELLASKEVPSSLTLRMGLSSAPVFTGALGAPDRREFTAMGNAVNLAARLMQSASDGQLLCDQATAAATAQSLHFNALPPARLKGFAEAVPLFEPVAEREEEAAAHHALVEREAAQEILLACVEGRAGPVALTGEAGLGKTALVLWTASKARSRGIPVSRVPLGSYSVHRPYAAWRGPVRALLEVRREDLPDRLRQVRDEALSDEPAGYRPLLNPLLDLPDESSPALRNLSPKEKKDLTFAVLSRLFARGGPRVVLLDNLHFADPLSVAFLHFLLDGEPEARPRIAVSMRPGHPDAEAAASRMSAPPLAPLSPEGARLTLAEACALRDVEPGVLEWVHRRSKGNPAVLRALVAALAAQGLVAQTAVGPRIDQDRLFKSSFPETLEGLYLAPVDALPAREKAVLQHASVLGYDVSGNLLREICGLEPGLLEGAADALAARGFLVADSWGERPYLRFADALLRDAVYESAPFSLKRADHLTLARRLEAEGIHQPKLWGVLAHHYEAGGEETTALTYHRLAGRDAVSRYDNLTALRHLEPACAKLSADPKTVDDSFSLMDVYWTLGRPADASRLLEQTKTFEETLDLKQKARLCNYLSEEAARQQDFAQAEQHLLRGIALSKKAKDVVGQGKALVNLVGTVYGPTGQLQMARAALKKVLTLPRGQGQTVIRTTAAMNLGVVLQLSSDRTGAQRWLERAYAESAKAGMGAQKALVSANLASLCYERGLFDDSITWATRSIKMLDSFSIRGARSYARHNLAFSHLAQGRVNRAEDILRQVETAALRQSDPQAHATALQGLYQAAYARCHLQRALSLAEQALTVYHRLSNRRDVAHTLADLCAIYYALQAKQALRHFMSTVAAKGYMDVAAGDNTASQALKRTNTWLEEGDDEEYVSDVESLHAPQDRLESMLVYSEQSLAHERCDKALFALRRIGGDIRLWPHVETRARFLRLSLLSRKTRSLHKHLNSPALMELCSYGVWGLRLLCLLALQEPEPRRARSLKKKALSRLEVFRANSPDWAWEALSQLPEVSPLL